MTTECAAVRDRAAELALGILAGEERAEVVAHLGTCPACQAFVDEHNEVADLLPQLAPAVEPPPGFEQRVLRSFGAQRRRSRRRMVAAVAAAVAVATITSIAVVRVIDADRDAGPRAAPTLHSVSMIGADGTKVGRVTFSDGNPAGMAVYVDYAIADAEYSLVLRSGSTEAGLGQLKVVDGRGEWSGYADLPASRHSTVVLRRQTDGETVCEAELDA